MENTKIRTLIPYAVADAALIAAACLIPALSHAAALPLYKLNPMLALLLAGMAVGKADWRNGLLLAVAMPLVSCLVAGMPTAGKMVCMVAELATVAGLFGVLQKHWKTLPAVLVAAVAGKGVYYALKALIVAPAVLVGTNWLLQAAVLLLWCGLFAMLCKKAK